MNEMEKNYEKLYSPSQWSVRLNATEVLKEFEKTSTETSNEVMKNYPHETIRYGNKEREYFMLFGKDLPPGSPVKIFIHGGYWVFCSPKDSCYMVPHFVDSKIVTIIVGYSLAPKATLKQIVEEVLSALKTIQEIVIQRSYGHIWLSGFSAGGHLTLMACKFMDSEFMDLVKGVFLYSSVFDLEPLSKMSVNNDLKFTKHDLEDLNPIRQIESIARGLGKDSMIYVINAANDSPAFKDEGKRFSEEIMNYNKNCFIKIIDDTDHFNLMTNFYFKEFELKKKLTESILCTAKDLK